jgi:hypothetical protein
MDFPGTTKKPVQSAQQSGFDNAKLYIWVKALETKVNNITRELNVLKGDFTQKHNSLKKEMKVTSDEVLDMKHGLSKTLEKMDLIIKELKRTAGIEEVETLKKYIDLWSPLNFVTQRDLDRALDAKISQIKENLKNKKGDN